MRWPVAWVGHNSRRTRLPGDVSASSGWTRAYQRFRQEAGMPKERAMQLLDALQQNEKTEQQKALALKRAQRKKGKDW